MSAPLELASLSALPSEDAVRLLSFAQDVASLREIAGVTEVVKHAARDLLGSDGVTFVLREGEQVFMNLISNAIKYGRGEPITVDVAAAGGHARLAVADRGPGIAPEHHERIFQPFARLDPNEQGVGLGLWMVRKILQAHDGTIEVHSHPGDGTTMVVHLPLATPRPAAGPRSVN